MKPGSEKWKREVERTARLLLDPNPVEPERHGYGPETMADIRYAFHRDFPDEPLALTIEAAQKAVAMQQRTLASYRALVEVEESKLERALEIESAFIAMLEERA